MAEWGSSDSDGLAEFNFEYFENRESVGNEWRMYGKSWVGSLQNCYERAVKKAGGPEDVECLNDCDSYKCGE
jgi:hypothetical protein